MCIHTVIYLRLSGSDKSDVTKLEGKSPIPRLVSPFHQFTSLTKKRGIKKCELAILSCLHSPRYHKPENDRAALKTNNLFFNSLQCSPVASNRSDFTSQNKKIRSLTGGQKQILSFAAFETGNLECLNHVSFSCFNLLF